MSRIARRPEYLPSFARRTGRKLPPPKRALLRDLLPKLEITVPESGEIDLPALFPKQSDIRLEIGFGSGEHLAELAGRYPESGFIGAEPFLNGVTGLLDKIRKRDLQNIRIVAGDVRPIMAVLPDNALSVIYLLFPDPWPKSRHFKRRIVNSSFLELAARILRPGGILQLATDHEDYSIWMLEQLLTCRSFDWHAESVHDWHESPQDWVCTRYETKTRLQGRQPVYLTFVRK